jgi:hypothetical protein
VCNDYFYIAKQTDSLREGVDMSTSLLGAVDMHRFKVGNMVYLTRERALGNAVRGPYEVLALLPERDGDLQYRIKSGLERYQRVAQERDLGF